MRMLHAHALRLPARGRWGFCCGESFIMLGKLDTEPLSAFPIKTPQASQSRHHPR